MLALLVVMNGFKGLVKIVSGGQTGVDRAALDAALELGIEAGGWCPKGRMAEDGAIPDRYPLTVLPGAGYRKRTEQNVIDSDGTAVIHFGELSGGTGLTVDFCRKWKKPYLLIDGEQIDLEEAACLLDDFVTNNGIHTLNVAGPRASGEPRAYSYAKEVMLQYLGRFK